MPTADVIINGNFADITGSGVQGSIEVHLRNYGDSIPVVSGTSVIIPTRLPVQSNVGGAWTVTLWRNSLISPGSTYYEFHYLDSSGADVARIAYPAFTNAGTFDISTIAPLVNVPGKPAIQPSFASLTSGLNLTAAMVVGSGSSLTFSGSGTINASAINGVPVSGNASTSGKVPITQGDGTAVWGTVTSTIGPPSPSVLGGVFSLAAVSHKFLTSIGTDGTPTAAQPAFTDISGTVAASQLPNPGASSLGGIQSFAGSAHNFVTSISTLGVVSAAQPAFTDISGTVAASQLPNPSATTLGGIQSFAGSTHNFVTSISTSGVVSAAQPAFTDISGTLGTGQLPTIDTATNTVKIGGIALPSSAGSANQVLAMNSGGTGLIFTTVSGGSSAPFPDNTALVMDSVDNTKTLTVNVNNTTGINGTLTTVFTTAKTLTLPDATDTLTGKATTDTLTNKTISTSGTGNHIQIASADLPTAVGASNTFLGTLNGTSVVFNAITRSVVDATAKGWQFIGTATGATTTVGPVTTSSTFKQFMVKYQIKGYSGGTPVGRFLCANGTPSTTALTNSFSIHEGVTTPTTGAGGTAIPGLPLAVTLSNTQRSGTIFIDGASGAVKVMDVIGNEQTPSVSTAPTLFRGASFFSDLGSNLPLQQFQLTVYDTLTAVAASSNTFVTGTYLAVWGRNTD